MNNEIKFKKLLHCNSRIPSYFKNTVKNQPNPQYCASWWTYLTILFKYILKDKSWESNCGIYTIDIRALCYIHILFAKKKIYFNGNSFNH